MVLALLAAGVASDRLDRRSVLIAGDVLRMAALGAIAALAHPLSVIAAFIAAPLKPFRPGVPASAFSAGVEAWLHKPRVADFDSLRDDVAHWSGWWKNRIARTLLNFMFVTLGTLIGEYVAGFHIIKNLL
jgi:pheromone shutdown protein TraB